MAATFAGRHMGYPQGVSDLDTLVGGAHSDPHSILGAHPQNGGVVVRTFRPDAERVTVRPADGEAPVEATQIHPGGVFEAKLEAAELPVRYELEVAYPDGSTYTLRDPYAFTPTLSDMDLHLAAEGRHERIYCRLGAHVREVDGVQGTAFAVWAPAARSVVHSSSHEWTDGEWMARRREQEPLHGPMSIYEVHLGSWRRDPSDPERFLTYRELADELAAYARDMGFTHIELLPVMAHPFPGSWGYQVTGQYAPSPFYGTPDEFKQFVDRLHENGIGLLLDWVPAHFPRDDWALARFDGTALYEHEDPRRGAHPDWGTLVYNFGRNEVRNFLLASALWWLREYHADGIRVDAVASMLYLDYSREEGQWVPNEYGGNEDLEAVAFLKELNEVIHREEPGIISAAEESTAWPGVSRPTYVGGLGFGFKWNMGWMHDTLAYFQQDPVYRRWHHHSLTFSLVYAFSENFILPLSHDEVVHGKGSLLQKMGGGDKWQKLANLRALYGYMWSHPGKKLLFMGQEFAQEREWSHERSLDWHLLEDPQHAGVQSLVRDLNRVYKDHPALWEIDTDDRGFWWIEANDAANNVLAYARAGAGEIGERDLVVVILNLAPVVRSGYRLGLPRSGRWVEALNTDSSYYGGGDVGNLGGVEADPIPWHGQPFSAEVTLPPLSALWLVPEAPGTPGSA
jgi:1,4-alpha-glucan branching enzyme